MPAGKCRRSPPGSPAAIPSSPSSQAGIPVTANGQPAFAFYARDPAGIHRPHALHVLTLTKAGISRIVSFQDPGIFPLFGLPADRIPPNSRAAGQPPAHRRRLIAD